MRAAWSGLLLHTPEELLRGGVSAFKANWREEQLLRRLLAAAVVAWKGLVDKNTAVAAVRRRIKDVSSQHGQCQIAWSSWGLQLGANAATVGAAAVSCNAPCGSNGKASLSFGCLQGHSCLRVHVTPAGCRGAAQGCRAVSLQALLPDVPAAVCCWCSEAVAGAAAGPGTHPRVAARHAARHVLLVLVAVEAQGSGAVALEGSAGLARVQVGAPSAASC